MLSESVSCEELSADIEYWNNYYEVYDQCIKSYSKKTLSQHDFEKIVLKHGSEELLDNIIRELKEKNIVNDDRYKKSYIASYEDNVKYSSNRIEEELSKLQIFLCEKELESLKLLDFDKATKVVDSLCLKTKNKSKYEMLAYCKNKLYTYKYDNKIIEDVLKDLEYDETAAVEVLFRKLLRRNDIDTVVKKLYAKGYNYDLVLEIKERLDD